MLNLYAQALYQCSCSDSLINDSQSVLNGSVFEKILKHIFLIINVCYCPWKQYEDNTAQFECIHVSKTHNRQLPDIESISYKCLTHIHLTIL